MGNNTSADIDVANDGIVPGAQQPAAPAPASAPAASPAAAAPEASGSEDTDAGKRAPALKDTKSGSGRGSSKRAKFSLSVSTSGGSGTEMEVHGDVPVPPPTFRKAIVLGPSGEASAALSGSTFDLDGILVTEQHRKEAKLAHFLNVMSPIATSLYSGSERVAVNETALAEQGITTIVNAAADICASPFVEKEGLSYVLWFLYDSPKQELSCFFPAFIHTVVSTAAAGGNVLVHCSQGVSRSGGLAIAYLMWRESLPFHKAYTRARELRGTISPNAGFICQLLEWEQLLRVVRDTPDATLLYWVETLRVPTQISGPACAWLTNSDQRKVTSKYCVNLARSKDSRTLVRPSKLNYASRDCVIIRSNTIAYICVSATCEDVDAKVEACIEEIGHWQVVWQSSFEVVKCKIGEEPQALVEALILGGAIDITTPMTVSPASYLHSPASDGSMVLSPAGGAPIAPAGKSDQLRLPAKSDQGKSTQVRTATSVATPRSVSKVVFNIVPEPPATGAGGPGAGEDPSLPAAATAAAVMGELDLTSVVPTSAALPTSRLAALQTSRQPREASLPAASDEPPLMTRGGESDDEAPVARPRLFQYSGDGGWDNLGVFDEDDLMPDSLLVLLPPVGSGQLQAFVWCGGSFTAPAGDKLEDFVGTAARKCAQEHMQGDATLLDLQVQQPGEESDEFWDMFET